MGIFGMDNPIPNMPVIGPLLGPSGEEKDLQNQMRRAAAQYAAMRPQMAEASTQSMQNIMGGIAGPGNQMMGQVYGPGAQMDFAQAFQNPLAGIHEEEARNAPAKTMTPLGGGVSVNSKLAGHFKGG